MKTIGLTWHVAQLQTDSSKLCYTRAVQTSTPYCWLDIHILISAVTVTNAHLKLNTEIISWDLCLHHV